MINNLAKPISRTSTNNHFVFLSPTRLHFFFFIALCVSFQENSQPIFVLDAWEIPITPLVNLSARHIFLFSFERDNKLRSQFLFNSAFIAALTYGNYGHQDPLN